MQIQQQGYYTVNNTRVDISAAQKRSENFSKLFTPEEGRSSVELLPPPGGSQDVSCAVINASTVKAIIDAAKTGEPTAALNFASAKNPGGGFLNGAIAQEEALAACSGLYSTQLKHMEYYEKNRAYKSMTYTDHAIYSPDVVFFRDENNNLLKEPVICSILTLPAVNMSQVKAKGEDINQAKRIMKNRMRLALTILAVERNRTIILGAYGCGVFGNDPLDVARWWQDLLMDEKFGGYFNRVLFVILDKPNGVNIKTFERVFGN